MNEYYYINRPPGIGCQPSGFDPDTRESWVPRRELGGMYYWGKVSYPGPLSHQNIHRYELRPVDRVEYAHYVFWQQDAGEWLERYLSTDPGILWDCVVCSGSILAQAALVILEAREVNDGHGD